jgi:hypothetical protein
MFDRNPTCAEYLTAAEYIMIREAVDDTVLNVPNADGKPGTTQVPIPKGLPVIVDVVGIRELKQAKQRRRRTYLPSVIRIQSALLS